ncbi:MAG: sigma 54-interacting transcriptional regulator [Desulfovibrio sp.]|jgi:PAS domain S-box-containing protein|nr:sigma 54-interacting transcriptional regulator [Desulfovibrio sp.]
MKSYSPDFLSRHFESILDAIPDGVFISDAEGISLRINLMYEQLTGLRQEEVRGKNVRDLVREGVFDHVLNPEIVATGKPATHVQTLQNGKKLVLSGFPVFSEDGRVALVVTFARDITILAQMNEQIGEQRRLIEQINEQLAYMAHGQTHDIPHQPVFASAAMEQALALARRFAVSDATVLILGETGVGKDVFARMVHSLSGRGKKMLLKVDCGGISETLTESELFGYMPGSFTGALSKGKAGYFEIADGGTIFLDEVGDLPMTMQTRLLRVLQDGEIMRVGASSPRRVDVRVIAATNRNLAENVEAGTFRRDLYYRLNVATIHIPPLRRRPEDVRPLAEHFLRQYAAKYHRSMALMDVTLDMMGRYAWPGNVRELQNLVHSLVITLKGSLISPRDLPAQISGIKPGESICPEEMLSVHRPLKDITAEMERNFLLRAIEEHGSVQKVAKLFQVDRSTIFRKMQRPGQSARPVPKV